MASQQRLDLIHQIEKLISQMIVSISVGEHPCFDLIVEDHEGNLRAKKVDWGNGKSRKKFTIMMTIMSRAHELLQESRRITKRDLYYENVNLYGSQVRVEQAIHELAIFLEVSPSAFPFVPSAKGLMAAGENLVLMRADENGKPVGVALDKTGTLVQGFAVIKEWGNFISNAKFVLIVEKDAIFYRLTEDNIFDRFDPFILVTGKGYPDKGTRAMVSKLNRELRIPVFALVDADPYGLEIASNYKWGSVKMKDFPHENLALATPDLILIGVLPSEISSLGIPTTAKIPFESRDRKKLDSFIARIKIYNDPVWIEEAETLKELDFKTEIEGVASLGTDYFCKEYLYDKIHEWLNIYCSSDA